MSPFRWIERKFQGRFPSQFASMVSHTLVTLELNILVEALGKAGVLRSTPEADESEPPSPDAEKR